MADVPEEETPAVEATPQPDEPMDVMTALQQVITGTFIRQPRSSVRCQRWHFTVFVIWWLVVAGTVRVPGSALKEVKGGTVKKRGRGGGCGGVLKSKWLSEGACSMHIISEHEENLVPQSASI